MAGSARGGLRCHLHLSQSRARTWELRKALIQVNREIENYARAVARGHFTSLDAPLGAAEQRRAILQAELAQLDGKLG